MTPNLIITLLSIYRGSYAAADANQVTLGNVRVLLSYGLIEATLGDKSYCTTTRGETYIQKLRSITP